jgi:hypothetical protein
LWAAFFIGGYVGAIWIGWWRVFGVIFHFAELALRPGFVPDAAVPCIGDVARKGPA